MNRSAFLYLARKLCIEATILLHHRQPAQCLIDQVEDALENAGTLPRDLCS